jgi:hypothetical protein
LPSIAALVNGNGFLNRDNMLGKSSAVQDVKDGMEIKSNNMDNIGTRKEKSPPCTLIRKGHASRGGENGEALKKTIADASFKVGDAYVKEESEVEKFGLINASLLKHGEENASRCRGLSPVSNGLSRVILENSSKKVDTVKLDSSRRLVSLSKDVHPQIKEEDGYSSFSNGNLFLCTTLRGYKPSVPACEGTISHGKQSQALTKIKREPIGGPKCGKMGPIGVLQQKRKSPIQQFARSPQITKWRGKTPFM